MRRRAAPVALVFALLYVAGAAVSGHLSPTARRPILDGIAPAEPYRWVNPPPGSVANNLAPTSGDFTIRMGPKGSHADAVTIPDAQVTFILVENLFPPSKGATSVRLLVEPVDPATLGSFNDPSLQITGNAYRVRAIYEPSGIFVSKFNSPLEAIVVYPFTTGGS